jgi:hypothetical protein
MTRLPRNIDLQLPPASPHAYVRLAELWRDVQEVMVANPARDGLVLRDGEALLPDPVAEYLSSVVIRQVMDEASWAAGERQQTTSPRIQVDEDLMHLVLSDLTWHSQWLEREGVLEALGIRLPEQDVMDLRVAVLRSIGQQLAQETGWTRPLGLPNSPEAVPAS